MTVRVVGWQVQPVVMVDDGEHLTPLQVSGRMVPAAEWESFKAGGDVRAIDQIRGQIDGDAP